MGETGVVLSDQTGKLRCPVDLVVAMGIGGGGGEEME